MILLFALFSLVFSTQASFSDEFNVIEYNQLANQVLSNYSRYDTIVDFVISASKVCEFASFGTFGKTYEGRDMVFIKFSSNPGMRKPIILVDAGIHAREWIAPSTAVYLIAQLCSPVNRDLLTHVDWYIIPVLNPDGYEYTHTHDRFWRKTRSWNGNNCYGTDLNRNFDVEWMSTGSSFNECAANYGGPHPFSEVEARNFKSFVLGFASRIRLYVSLHSYGSQILYPYGYRVRKAYNDDELHMLGKLVAFNIGMMGGNDYDVGMTAEVIYEAAGGSDDWMKSRMKVPLVYTIELPGEGFDPPPSQILPVGEEIFRGFEVFYHYIEDNFAK